MGYVFSALWHGIVAGAAAKSASAAPQPTYTGLFGSVASALYALGYTVAAIVVHGRSPQ